MTITASHHCGGILPFPQARLLISCHSSSFRLKFGHSKTMTPVNGYGNAGQKNGVFQIIVLLHDPVWTKLSNRYALYWYAAPSWLNVCKVSVAAKRSWITVLPCWFYIEDAPNQKPSTNFAFTILFRPLGSVMELVWIFFTSLSITQSDTIWDTKSWEDWQQS